VIRAVLFDYDGVLVDSMEYHVQAWQEVFRAYGVDVERRTVLLNEGIRSVDMAQKLIKAHGLKMDEAELLSLVERKQELYRRLTKARMLPEAEALVRDVCAAGLATALVTGSARDDLEPVLTAEQRRLFEVMITADDVEHGKPAPDPYLRAAESLRLEPSTCLVIENAPLGIRAAKAAGMPVVALEVTLQAEDLAGADLIVKHHSELRKRLPEILHAFKETAEMTEVDR
jgi:beta-phosphoglucomutase